MKLFVWDFHGVLEKGNKSYCQLVSNLVLEREGFKERFSKKDINFLYGLKWWQFYEHILPDESNEKHKFLENRAFEINNEIMSSRLKEYVKANDYSTFVLSKINNSGHDQIVISNSAQEGLEFFLDVVGLKSHFEKEKIIAVHGSRNSWDRTKKYILEDYINGKKYDKVVVIGDSNGDIELKHSIKNIPCVSFLYAHPGQPFRDAEADYRIRDLRAVLKEI